MRKRNHVFTSCHLGLGSKARLSQMGRVFLLILLFASFLGTACGQRNNDNEPSPGMAIPVHVITKADVGRTVEVESGDWLEFELPLADDPAAWEPRVEDGLPLTKVNELGNRKSEAGMVQVFRFQTYSGGSGKVTFDLRNPVAGTTSEQTFSFTIAIR